MTRVTSPSTDPDTMKAWRYAYNDAGDLVGTSDARGCGENFGYDHVGRLMFEDYSPCLDSQPDYTAPVSDPQDGNTGIEVVYIYNVAPQELLPGVGPPSSFAKFPDGSDIPADFFKGRLVGVIDRASQSWTDYDGRGRVIRVGKQLTKAGGPDENLSNRYAPRWYQRQFAFDGADREIGATTGAEVSELQGAAVTAGSIADNTSLVTTTYTARGTVNSIGGSYVRAAGASHISGIQRTADGLVNQLTYGDLAATTTHYTYDNRRRVRTVQTYRGPPSDWTAGTGNSTDYLPAGNPNGTPTTFQLLLEDTDYTYDPVNNPTEIHDWRNPAEWPGGAKPVTRKARYDDLYRLTRLDYEYSAGDDAWTDPFDAESQGVNADSRRGKPSPHVQFDNRVLQQTYQYDWLGNTKSTDDDAGGFYDRSLGTVTNDTASDKPYQLKHAANTQHGTTDRSGNLDARYDDAGNLTRMKVTRNGPCLPSAASCHQLFAYDWDEVGRLVEARRWDAPTTGVNDALPATVPDAHLKYLYNASDDRQIKQAIDGSTGESSYTLYLYSTPRASQGPLGRQRRPLAL